MNSEPSSLWPAEELAQILQHQLQANLWTSLRDVIRFQASSTAAETMPPINTFGDLFSHPNPPLELLTRVKDYSKMAIARHDELVPSDVCLVLYFASIAAARLRLGNRISSLDDSRIRAGASWALEQTWLDGSVRGLFHNVITWLDGGH